MNYGGATHWNHSKIILIDNYYSIVGGQNWYADKYLLNSPVFDLTMKLTGDLNRSTLKYMKKLWEVAELSPNKAKVCYPPNNDCDSSSPNLEFHDEIGSINLNTDRRSADSEDNSSYYVNSMTLGRVDGSYEEMPSEVGLAKLLGMAKESIKISQQNLGYSPRPFTHWHAAIIKALYEFIITKKKDVYIVQTNADAGDYSSGAVVPLLIEEIFKRGKEAYPDMKEGDWWALIIKHLHVATLRFSDDVRWPDEKGIANHSKFLMIDDEIFYIGSHNLYPPGPLRGAINLAEFGHVIESKRAAKELNERYWDKMVKYSKPMRVAINTDQSDYRPGDEISIFIKVENAKPNRDAVSYWLDNETELDYQWTDDRVEGELPKKYKVPEIARGRTITFRYIHEAPATYPRVVISMTTVDIHG